jgi:mannose-6-phosphate isomerase-like protein (cupin superfamily)
MTNVEWLHPKIKFEIRNSTFEIPISVSLSMHVVNLFSAPAFKTKDGSEIRSLLDLSTAPVKNQSLAEATLLPGQATERHVHPKSEEFYFVTQGKGLMEVAQEKQEIGMGDAVLIPNNVSHKLTNIGQEALTFLCCCAPPYKHEDTVLG